MRGEGCDGRDAVNCAREGGKGLRLGREKGRGRRRLGREGETYERS